MPEHQSPPSYAVATSGLASAPDYQGITERVQGFYYFHHTTRGTRIFDAINDSGPRYYVAKYAQPGRSDLVAYRSSDRIAPPSGQAKFSLTEEDFFISVDGPARFPAGQQELVRCIHDRNIFGINSYWFDVPGIINDTGEYTAAQTLAWRQTHRSNLGSSVWRLRDLELANETTGQTIAVYLHISKTRNVSGRLEWITSCSFDEEIRALIVLTALLERLRRSIKQTARALIASAVQTV